LDIVALYVSYNILKYEKYNNLKLSYMDSIGSFKWIKSEASLAIICQGYGCV